MHMIPDIPLCSAYAPRGWGYSPVAFPRSLWVGIFRCIHTTLALIPLSYPYQASLHAPKPPLDDPAQFNLSFVQDLIQQYLNFYIIYTYTHVLYTLMFSSEWSAIDSKTYG